MSTQHTPGPWETETKGSKHFIDGADELTVAYIDRAGVRDKAQIEANARLIAAAPELLGSLSLPETGVVSSLKYALTFEKQMPAAVAKRLRLCLEAARAAIAKAEGSS